MHLEGLFSNSTLLQTLGTASMAKLGFGVVLCLFFVLLLLPHFRWRFVVWLFPQWLPSDYCVLMQWVVEGGLKAANSYQLSSYFQGEKLQLSTVCLPVLQWEPLFRFTWISWLDMALEPSATRVQGLPCPFLDAPPLAKQVCISAAQSCQSMRWPGAKLPQVAVWILTGHCAGFPPFPWVCSEWGSTGNPSTHSLLWAVQTNPICRR